MLQAQWQNKSLTESNTQLSKKMEELNRHKKKLTDLEPQFGGAKNDCQQKEKLLQELESQLQQLRSCQSWNCHLLQSSVTSGTSTRASRKQMDNDKAALEKKMKSTIGDMEAKMKSLQTKWKSSNRKPKTCTREKLSAERRSHEEGTGRRFSTT